MQRSLELVNLKPFSINAAYANGGNGGRFKTQAFNEWQSEVFFQLSQAPNSVALKELREYFDSKKHKYEVQLIASYPKKEFYTKDGSISAKTQDTTNWEKSIVDCLFLKKYHDIPQPYGCKNLNVDDKFLTKCISEKVPSDSYSISIILYIKNL
jgi:hypothetical protein